MLTPSSEENRLPIEEHLEAISSGVEKHRVTLLEAPPGSGKTTLLPLHLAMKLWIDGKKILVLQPRRVAARSVATRMASLLGERVGETVGYQVRMERVAGPRTRIEVITEGLLTRRLISEPDLPDVGLIIFDEFHERSLQSDLSVVMAIEAAGSLRPDLRIVVMSATLGEQPNSGLLHDAWRYTFSARPFPLEVKYSPPPPRVPVWESVARAIVDAASRLQGDLLAFLPGRFEIERTRELVEARLAECTVLELYGEQPLSEQVKALKPSPSGARKIIISSPIAETSLTIDGVRIVVDSGLHKVARSNPHGVSLLSTERITQDAAEQRAGRAARTAPGTCIRLWSEHEQRAMRAQREPEVLRADLTPTLLDLAAWGNSDPANFAWITAPSNAQVAAASSSLRAMKAVDPGGRITEHGRVLSSLGTHPALAGMCLAARASGHARLAATILAVLEDRRQRRSSADLSSSLSEGALSQRVREIRNRWLSRIESLDALPQETRVTEHSAAAYLLASAFPGRIARQRQPGSERYLLACAQGAALAPTDPLRRHEFLVAVELQDADGDLRILAAVPLQPELLAGPLAKHLSRRTESTFDTARGALETREVELLGAIELKQRSVTAGSPDDAQAALLSFLCSEDGWRRLPMSATAESLTQRTEWVRRTVPSAQLPDSSNAALRVTVKDWLAPFLGHNVTLQSISAELVEQALLARLSHPQRTSLEREAPPHLRLKSGRLRPIRYDQPEGPIAEVILQDLFGTASTPLISSAKVPLTIALLSPAKRPVQVTRDLASFWRGAYHEVRKELRGRYPKHRWPEDPSQ
jgi:ATP-dependent helicase HrpB